MNKKEAKLPAQVSTEKERKCQDTELSWTESTALSWLCTNTSFLSEARKEGSGADL